MVFGFIEFEPVCKLSFGSIPYTFVQKPSIENRKIRTGPAMDRSEINFIS